MSRHVVVIGAGIVGASTALELVRDGCRVTILDAAHPGGPQAASFGNGAWLSPASVVPMSTPGLWRRVPGYLFDPAGPLTIRWSELPRLLPWLLRFITAGSSIRRVEWTAAALATLLADAPARHAALAAEITRPDLIRRQGLLYVYPNRPAFEADALAWRLRRDNGVRWLELGPEQLSAREPSLSPRYTFGALVENGAHCINPGGYVAALVAHAVSCGAALEHRTATGFSIDAGRLRSVRTNHGDLPCDRAVLAAGIGAKLLARAAGDRVPLESERGYHVELASHPAAPRTPIMPSDGKMANTPTARGLRIAGQVELASVGAAPDWRRAAILLRHANTVYPGLAAGEADVQRWLGHRPSTPDGLPVIGLSSASPDVIYAFGHGHVGLASGPITGRAAADLAQGLTPSLDLAPFRPTRF